MGGETIQEGKKRRKRRERKKMRRKGNKSKTIARLHGGKVTNEFLTRLESLGVNNKNRGKLHEIGQSKRLSLCRI